MEELTHHGVKGMRWGVRRRRSEDSAKTRAIRKKHIDEMTNQELRDANNRLQLERQYKDLTKRKSAIKTAVGAFVGTAATIAAVTNASKTYSKLANSALDKIGNWVIKDIKF